VAVVGIAFLSATCQSLSAFGFALVMVPLLSLVWDVKSTVVTSTFLGTALMVPLLYEVMGHVQPSRVTPMVLGSLGGIPAGLVVLRQIDASALQVVVAAVVIVAGLALYFSPQVRLRQPHVALSLLVGGLSGALRSATSMGGPPIVLYVLSFETEVDRFRATILAFLLPTSLVTVAGLAIVGLIDRDVLVASAVALPALAMGSIAGAWLRARVSSGVFQTLVLGILIASSVAVLVSTSGLLVRDT
jgi:uncharacterized membrane protein YfcA